jgi:hypothetical protein
MFVVLKQSEVYGSRSLLAPDCSGFSVESFSGSAPYFVMIWKPPHGASVNAILADRIIALACFRDINPQYIEAAYIITPPSVNKTFQWALAPLHEVWQIEARYNQFGISFTTHEFITYGKNTFTYGERTYKESYRELVFRTKAISCQVKV